MARGTWTWACLHPRSPGAGGQKVVWTPWALGRGLKLLAKRTPFCEDPSRDLCLARQGVRMGSWLWPSQNQDTVIHSLSLGPRWSPSMCVSIFHQVRSFPGERPLPLPDQILS